VESLAHKRRPSDIPPLLGVVDQNKLNVPVLVQAAAKNNRVLATQAHHLSIFPSEVSRVARHGVCFHGVIVGTLRRQKANPEKKMTGLVLGDLVRMATSELVKRALAGELRPSDAWTALRGAEKYRHAVASGDVASEQVQEERANKCWACPSSTSRTTASNATGVFCGAPFRETPITCGCLTAIRIEGKTYAGGKTVVASEQCPQKRW
jgi:hypothetical protein